jgi:glycosyltransferase involved in cell wall biosynthesis
VVHSTAPSTFKVFATLLSGGRPHLVHTHMTAAEAAALVALAWRRTPIVSTRHFPSRRGRRLPRPLSGLIRRCLAEQVAISKFVVEGIGEPCVLIHNGVHERDAATLKARRVLMLQRLESEKEPEVGIRAWARSQLARQGWGLTVAGDGRLGDALRRLAEELGVSESVSFIGWTAETDSLLDGSSIFLAPSSVDAFGLAVVEAMAHGIPVIAADGGAHRETLGAEGFFFTPGDVDAASEQLVALAADPVVRLAEGRRLRIRQRELFSLERHVDALEELYASILRRQPTARVGR